MGVFNFYASSTAAFAATPLGIGVLAFVAIALTSLAVYAINKNNEMSEVKAPKIVAGTFNENREGIAIQMTQDVYNEIKENNKHKNKDGNEVKGEDYIDFSLEGKDYRITIGQLFNQHSNTLLLGIASLVVKNDKGGSKITNAAKILKELGLGTEKNDAKEVNTYLGKVVVEQADQTKEK